MTNIKSFGNTLNPIFNNKNDNFNEDNNEAVLLLNINNIYPRKNQPRQYFDQNSLNELTVSIREQGIIQPIVVRSIGNGSYEIIVGERRWRAAKNIGLNKIPVIVKNYNSQATMIVALMENIHRQDLNPIEVATAIQSLITEYSLTHEKIAEKLGKARTTVSNTLRLLELSYAVKNLLEEGRIEMGHARALIGLNTDAQIKIANLIMDNQLTVRQTESLVNKYKKPYNFKTHAIPAISEEKINIWKKKLSEKIHANVDIKISQKGQGRVVINLHSIEEVNWLIENMPFLKRGV